MKTYSPKPGDIERRWYVIDASGAVLGRLATEVASILRGKHKPIFAPHMDTGDHVIVVNAKGVQVTGGKEMTKIAYRHSGYPGGLTETPYGRLLAEKPAFAVEKAIRGMLPKNRLGRQMIKKLQVYAGGEHPHAAQQPTELKLGQIPPWEGLPKPKERQAEAATAPTAKAKAPAAKRTTAKRTAAAKPASPAKPAAAKKTTAAKSTAKRPTAKASTAKRLTRRTKKKED